MKWPLETASSPKTRQKWVWGGLVELSTISDRSTKRIAHDAKEVSSALFNGGMKHVRIGEDKIGRSQHVEPLSSAKKDDMFMMLRDAWDVCSGSPPPLLNQQKDLGEQVEGPSLPLGTGKVLILWLKTESSQWISRVCGISRDAHSITPGFLKEMNLLSRRGA